MDGGDRLRRGGGIDADVVADLRAVWGIELTRTLAWLAFVGIGVFVALGFVLLAALPVMLS